MRVNRNKLRSLAIAGSLSLMVGGGIVYGSTVAPTSFIESVQAHTGDLKVTSVCVAGEYILSPFLTVSRTSLNGDGHSRVGTSSFEGTPTSANGMTNTFNVVGSGVYALPTILLPGNTIGYGPWVYSFVQFSNNFKVGSDGQLTTPLAGDCVAPSVTPAVLTPTPGTCLVEGSVNATETDKYSWVISGPIDARVYTAVAKTGVNLTGKTVYGPFDLSKTTGPTCNELVTPAVLTPTPGTCLVEGSVNATETDKYSWVISGPIDARVYTAVAKTGVTLTGKTVYGPFDLSRVTKSCALPATGADIVGTFVVIAGLIGTGLILLGIRFGWFGFVITWVRRRIGSARTIV